MIHEELISKYVTNEISTEESVVLLEWVSANEDNKKVFIDSCNAWHAAKLTSTSFNIEKAHTVFASYNAKPEVKVVKLWKKVSAVAAVILLFVSVFLVMDKEVDNTTITNNSTQTKSVELPDKSTIYLSNGASVTYPESFEENKRNISISGTVFCEVTKNPQAQFTVDCKTFKVEVLGTSFNISTEKKQVIVETGIVKVTNKATKEFEILQKNKQAVIENNSIVKSTNNDINYLSWKTGVIAFNNTPLTTVFKTIERHFNCTFKVSPNINVNQSITGTYKNMTLQQIVEFVNSTCPSLQFKFSDNNTIIVTL